MSRAKYVWHSKGKNMHTVTILQRIIIGQKKLAFNMLERKHLIKADLRRRKKTFQLKIWLKTNISTKNNSQQQRVKPTTQHAGNMNDLALHRNKNKIFIKVKYCYSAVHKMFAKNTKTTCLQESTTQYLPYFPVNKPSDLMLGWSLIIAATSQKSGLVR